MTMTRFLPPRGAAVAVLVAGLALPALSMLAPPQAVAQGIGVLNKSKSPVVIEADKGVEWRRKDKVYIAKGNATATQGKTRIRADELKAHYKQGAGGKTEIWKVTATGKVDIKTEKETATGDQAIYLVETGVFILRGKNLKLATKKQTITASDRIEYRSKDKRAYVVGNAKVVEGDKVIRASRFIAYLKDGEDGKVSMRRVEAVGGVIITTKNEVIRSNRGDYNGETKLATLTGDVKLTRGDNQLNGQKAIVNLETGISRMVGRVSVLLVPRSGEEGKSKKGSGPRGILDRSSDSKTKANKTGSRLRADAGSASGAGDVARNGQRKAAGGDRANGSAKKQSDGDGSVDPAGRIRSVPRLRGEAGTPQ